MTIAITKPYEAAKGATCQFCTAPAAAHAVSAQINAGVDADTAKPRYNAVELNLCQSCLMAIYQATAERLLETIDTHGFNGLAFQTPKALIAIPPNASAPEINRSLQNAIQEMAYVARNYESTRQTLCTVGKALHDYDETLFPGHGFIADIPAIVTQLIDRVKGNYWKCQSCGCLLPHVPGDEDVARCTNCVQLEEYAKFFSETRQPFEPDPASSSQSVKSVDKGIDS